MMWAAESRDSDDQNRVIKALPPARDTGFSARLSVVLSGLKREQEENRFLSEQLGELNFD